jgi:hypothetical protein
VESKIINGEEEEELSEEKEFQKDDEKYEDYHEGNSQDIAKVHNDEEEDEDEFQEAEEDENKEIVQTSPMKKVKFKPKNKKS